MLLTIQKAGGVEKEENLVKWEHWLMVLEKKYGPEQMSPKRLAHWIEPHTRSRSRSRRPWHMSHLPISHPFSAEAGEKDMEALVHHSNRLWQQNQSPGQITSIYSFNKYLWSACHMPGTVPDSGDTGNNTSSHEACILVGETDNTYTRK